MFAVSLALLASVSWGTADFCGGLFSRRWPPLSVLLVIETAGLLAAGLIVAFSWDAFPDATHTAYALGAGLAGVTGLALLYTALATGAMSVVAPISATGAIVPVAVGIVSGDPLTVLIGGGLVLALVGVMLAGQESAGPDAGGAVVNRRVVVLALGAALCFGTFFALYDSAADDSVSWAILLARAPAIPLLGAIVWRRGLAVPRGADLVRLVPVAQLDCIATALYAVAVTRGALSVVAVIGSLYPVATVLLARLVLAERLRLIQAAGVAIAFVGVALVSLGSA